MDLAAERAYLTPYSNSPFLPLLLLTLATQRHTPKTADSFKSEYDYIIVGAGSAGSTLASRLTEKKCVSILLLEAGKKAPLLNEIPAIAKYFWFTDLDWQYKTVPQIHTGRGLVNRQVNWPSGKAIGGSSILNTMVYVKGNQKNYDDWEKMGATGWNYDSVLPYFKKLEDYRDPKYIANDYHGVGGPLTVEESKYNTEVQNAIKKAFNKKGYQMIDINGPTQTGYFELQTTQRNSQRCSVAKAYLVPAENRTNLDILDSAHVRKLVVNNKRVTGVIFDHKGGTHYVKAKREVILAAGTTNSAQILMLSGIGPKEHLRELKVPVEVDLPVGNNFHDHAGAVMFYEVDSGTPTINQKVENESNIQEYINKRTGPLSSLEFVILGASVNTSNTPPGVNFPGLMIAFGELTSQGANQLLALKPEFAEKKFGTDGDKPLLACGILDVQPKSRGTVRLNSTNPHDPPLIDPNYLEHPDDLRDMMDGMKICDDILLSDTVRNAGVRAIDTRFPGCEAFERHDERYMECYLRTQAFSFSHQVGTCKMGDPKDPSTVVDSKLRVKGIQGLRVVDASVMPIVPSANTNVPTIMVAEKAADIIKETIQCDDKKKIAFQTCDQFTFWRKEH